MASGPQSFAPAVSGMEHLDPVLVNRSWQIETTLLSEAATLRQKGDFRWFFTLAHAEITKLINKNISAFQRPNALMRLNISFSEQFVRALWVNLTTGGSGRSKLAGPCRAVQQPIRCLSARSSSVARRWLEFTSI
jgi:hypothetical protein